MVCSVNKIDSNVSGLSYAVEECLGQLPTTPTWQSLEPNSFSDFGAELSTVTRSPIDPTRQNSKGTISDVNASGGFNIDVTKTNLQQMLQGFFFADCREMPTTKSIIGAGSSITIKGVVGSSETYTAASGLDAFSDNELVYMSGFSNATNNGLKTVASSTAATLVVNEDVVDETPTSTAKIETVGYQFASGDVDIDVTSNIMSMVSLTTDFTTLTNFIPGAWVFIGSDTAANAFANNVGFARIKTVSANAVVFDKVEFTPVTEAGTGKAIRVFAGNIIKNENSASLIKRYSFQFERTLGEGATSTQAEYLIGAVANEFSLNIPSADKINADMSFVGINTDYRSGESGDELKAGNRSAALGESAINTSSDLGALKMYVLDSATSTPTSLFAYVTDASLTISNSVTPTKAVGVVGAFDTTSGNFVVSGSITAYFADTAAVQAVKNNANVGFNVIAASENSGFVYDIPLLSLGGGRVTVEKDNPIKIPLTPNGAKNANGYTMLYQSFAYLPTVAM